MAFVQPNSIADVFQVIGVARGAVAKSRSEGRQMREVEKEPEFDLGIGRQTLVFQI